MILYYIVLLIHKVEKTLPPPLLLSLPSSCLLLSLALLPQLNSSLLNGLPLFPFIALCLYFPLRLLSLQALPLSLLLLLSLLALILQQPCQGLPRPCSPFETQTCSFFSRSAFSSGPRISFEILSKIFQLSDAFSMSVDQQSGHVQHICMADKRLSSLAASCARAWQ